jgi:hypothetical protein
MVTSMEHWWKAIDIKKTETLGEEPVVVPLLTRTDLRSNPYLRKERPETERLSHGTV